MIKKTCTYKDCGLDNVIVRNIDFAVDHEGNAVYEIPNVRGLHKAISVAILRQNRHLSAKEIRYLRTECGWTQSALGNLLNKDGQTIGRWERGEFPADQNDDVLMRLIFGEALGIDPTANVADMLRDCGPIVDMVFLEIEGEDPGNYRPVAKKVA